MRPNILFLTTHDLGRHLSAYGRPSVVSPALDALGNNGIVFDHSFCTAPQCSPSRAALHTGRHAHANGVMGLTHSPFDWRLHPDEKHIAQRLREAGYHTALLGVQHLTKTSEVEALGYQTFDRIEPVVPAPALAEKAAAFLRNAADSEQPFYLEVGFFEPHRPYDWGGAQPDRERGVSIPPYLPDGPEARAEFAELQGAIRQMDAAVGRILAALDDAGLRENTWVIFTTDHGLAMPRAKCTLYDAGIETALMMRWPEAGIDGGKRCREMISHVDIVPTVLEGLGLPADSRLHGRSFWPLMHDTAYTPNEQVFAEKTFHQYYEPMRCVRTTTHKLIVNFEIDTGVSVPDDVREGPLYGVMVRELTGARSEVELYDLARDPEERENLAGTPEMRETETELMDTLRSWMEATDDPLLSGPIASPFRARVTNRLGIRA